MSGLSILDRPVRLAELFEPDAVTHVARAFVDQNRVGLRLYDAEHRALVEVTRGEALFDWLFEAPEAKRALTAFISRLKRAEVDDDDRLVLEDPVANTRFLVLPVVYEFDRMGKLVLGPYRPPGPTARVDTPLAAALDAEALGHLREPLRPLEDGDLEARAEVLLRALDAIFHAGYRSLLTSNMHLEAITEAYNDLQTANTLLERRNAELQSTNARLLELDELKSNFLATVSHELRTPLTSVIGYSEMMLEGLAGPLNEEQREYIQTIMERGESLLHLISGILDISKIERGGQNAINREPVEAATLVETALSTVRPQALKGQLNLERRLAADLPVLNIDRYKTRQVLVNLLSNAVKFTPPGGTVSIEVEIAALDDGRPAVRFAVHDSGIGIPEAEQARVFEAFYQVDNSSTREYGGTGLGLSIAHSFVHSHGGQLSLESTPGEGSTFIVRLPLDAGDG